MKKAIVIIPLENGFLTKELMYTHTVDIGTGVKCYQQIGDTYGGESLLRGVKEFLERTRREQE